ncbi:MAG: hypothetical protein AB7R69_01935 [Candidatus Babeliales bacterium]
MKKHIMKISLGLALYTQVQEAKPVELSTPEKVGIFATACAAVAGIGYWLFWPESDEAVLQKAHTALEEAQRNLEHVIRGFEYTVGCKSGYQLSENDLRTLYERFSGSKLLDFCNMTYENNLDQIRQELTKRITKSYNNYEKGMFVFEAQRAVVQIEDFVKRIKNFKDIVTMHKHYFEFCSLQGCLHRSYGSEFMNMPKLSYAGREQFLERLVYNIRKEFPALYYVQNLNRDIRNLESHIQYLNRYSVVYQDANGMLIILRDVQRIVSTSHYYKKQELERKEKELREKEARLAQERIRQREREAALQAREDYLALKEAGQFVTGVCQGIQQVSLEYEKEKLKQEQNSRPCIVVYCDK